MQLRARSVHVISWLAALVYLAAVGAAPLAAYPPAVGILGQSRNCRTCHVDNGPWKDETRLIIDILDRATGKSLRQKDGAFLISVKRGKLKTVFTVIGWRAQEAGPVPYRNAWLYIDPTRIADSSSLSKFAPGWTVNLPMSCRIVGDTVEAYPGARVTALPMTVRPGDDAGDAELELQVMLTRGESVKGQAQQGLEGNYFQRLVRFRVE